MGKNRILIGGIVVVILVVGGSVWYLASSKAPSFSTYTVGQGNVVQSVDEPGSVLAESNADLSFREAGQIASVNVTEGQSVSAGQTLASLDRSQLNSAVLQANAAVAAAQARLDELASGTRPEQLQIDASAVTSAQASLGVAVEGAFTATDDAVTNQTDNLFSNPQGNNPTFLVPVSNSQLQITVASDRVSIGSAINVLYTALNSSSSAPASLSGTADTLVRQVQPYLDSLALAVNDAVPTFNITAANIAQFKVNVATARTEVSAAVGALTGAESALQSAQNNLALAQAGSTPQDIEAQKAAVLQAQAAASSAETALQNASIVAPFSGVVQNLTAQVGQVVSPGVPMLSLINNSGLKIQAYVSETDVAQIKAGDQANITLDAFGTNTVFPATVTTVDAAETQVNGTPAYQVTLHFTNPNSQIKDGMTGSVHIVLAEHDNVLEVPSNLVINNNNNYFVLVPNGKTTSEQQVQIGLTGDNNMTEITSGLTTGQKISNF